MSPVAVMTSPSRSEPEDGVAVGVAEGPVVHGYAPFGSAEKTCVKLNPYPTFCQPPVPLCVHFLSMRLPACPGLLIHMSYACLAESSAPDQAIIFSPVIALLGIPATRFM